MNLNQIYSPKRTGVDYSTFTGGPRSDYQKDYDRIIFSSAFRRLQNKTQVFPLPGSVFVHNRLTHSLEVSSVGRSLGQLVGEEILTKYNGDLTEESKIFYKDHLKNVIAAAALCHDIGNPAFGHSGEDAITSYFIKHKDQISNHLSDDEFADLIAFEGNANSLRVLSHQQNGKSKGGLRLTYSTLAAISKYPCESIARDKKVLHRKKFGFLQSEKDTFIEIAKDTGMVRDVSIDKISYYRHPFVWLVEAADDICYNIIDLEDAHRLNIISTGHCVDLLYSLAKCLRQKPMDRIDATLKSITDKNEKVGYLRAITINYLVSHCFQHFLHNIEPILEGKHNVALFDRVAQDCGDSLNEIKEFSIENIYNHRSVLEIENAGYHVIDQLLNHFITPILKDKKSTADNKALRLIPKQYLSDDPSKYAKIMSVVDYISGMTDLYATDLYKKVRGIDIGLRN